MSTPLKCLGEDALLARLLTGLPTNGELLVGPGDDCAVVVGNAQYDFLLKTDVVVEDVHFERGTDPELIGRKFAWPCAEIAVMGAQGAVPILYNRELKAIEDPAAREARRAELQQEYTEAFYNPYAAAASDQLTEIIDPKETRARVALTLRTLLNKSESRPAKKHGNMPL